MHPNPAEFLGHCKAIDHDSPDVAQLAASLASNSAETTARNCFEFVRDEIKHSSDHQLNPITYSASQVLQHGTGYCYAKSHLLCALLRANEIPAGLSYQRLSIDGEGEPFSLHGLVAVHLPEHGWYRIDPRGNREDINAQFDPPHEHLAFATDLDGEYDLPGIHVAPIPEVAQALAKFQNWDDLLRNLPDAPPEIA